MLRLVDQPRPVAWRVLRFVSKRYQRAYEMRHLADWQRVVGRRALYLPARQFLFSRNAKAASSTVTRLVAQAGRTLAERGEQGLLGWLELGADIAAPLQDATVYRCSFVRHPALRAVSAFNNMFVDRNNGFEWRHVPYMRHYGLVFGEATSANFDRFIAYARDAMAESPDFCDAHIRLQSRNLGLPHMAFNRLGRVETYADDLARIVAEAGLADLIDPVRPTRENRSGPKGYGAPTQAQLEALYALYEEDYDRLGYARAPAETA